MTRARRGHGGRCQSGVSLGKEAITVSRHTRRGFVRRVSLPALTLMAGPALGASSQRPSIVLIMADDMGFSDIGCYGSEIAKQSRRKRHDHRLEVAMKGKPVGAREC